MSRENVELHRRLYAASTRPTLEASIPLFDPQIEYHSRFATVGGVTVYRGHDGLRSWSQDLEEVRGDEIRIEPEAYFDLGEHTLGVYVLRARGRQSGVETTMRWTWVARWHDGLCVYLKSHTDWEEALGDLGLSEDELERIDP